MTSSLSLSCTGSGVDGEPPIKLKKSGKSEGELLDKTGRRRERERERERERRREREKGGGGWKERQRKRERERERERRRRNRDGETMGEKPERRGKEERGI